MKHSKAACTAELYFDTVLFILLHHVLQTQQTGEWYPSSVPFFRVSTQSVKFSNLLFSLKRALSSTGCIKFVYTEHKYKSSEPFCSRSQYGERRILFFLLLRLWINSFDFTMWMKLLNSPFCVVSIVFYEFRKVKFRIFRKFSYWQIVYSELSGFQHVGQDVSLVVLSGLVIIYYLCSPSQVQDTKPKRRLDRQNMIRLKYILFKKFEKSRDAGFPAYHSLHFTECLPTLWTN